MELGYSYYGGLIFCALKISTDNTLSRSYDTFKLYSQIEETGIAGGMKMTECEVCDEFFDDDDIQECPNCGMILCEHHYQEHVKQCGDRFDEDNECG